MAEPKVEFCNWCPDPKKPSPVYHLYGHPCHDVPKTWVEIAAGLRRAGYTTTYAPVPGVPDYLWRSPDGLSGSDWRSKDPDAPPEAVMMQAYASSIIGFLHLAKA